MIYGWDPRKADANLRKHDVSFEEAATVFADPFALSFDDPDHSDAQNRFITIGMSDRNRIIFLAHADGAEDRIGSSARARRPRLKPMTTRNRVSPAADELLPNAASAH